MATYTDDAITTFLEAQASKLEALVDAAADVIFAKAWVSPGVDARRLLQDGSFPMAMLNDEGGRPHPHNFKLENRRFTVVVVLMNEFDTMGENAEKDLLNIMGVVRFGDGTNPGLELDTGNANVSWASDGPAQTTIIDQGPVIYSKSITFEYELKRS